MIIVLPSFSIAFWEFYRHHYLQYVFTMEQGNWLAPLIVLIVTASFTAPLFLRLDHVQKQLNQSTKINVKLEEREKMAHELHDGLAQSIFLLSVKVDKLERETGPSQTIEQIRSTITTINDGIRDSISNLRDSSEDVGREWLTHINNLIKNHELETGTPIAMNWQFDYSAFTNEERYTLFTIVREALFNIRKHSNATQIEINANNHLNTWTMTISDNGTVHTPFEQTSEHFGLRMMKERCQKLNWSVQLLRSEGKTRLEVTNQ
jgi:two-component system nitrate/nitrite sensor histidine kinase NarQ